MLQTTTTGEVSTQTAPQAPTREQILRLQSAMAPLACNLPEPRHLFAPGLYLRELLVPKGMLIVGKTHRHAHFLFVTKGRALVLSEFGAEEVAAGHFSVSQPGIKRVALALEDTVFVNVHANRDDSQDLAVIEAEHIEPEDMAALQHGASGVLQ